MDISRLLLIVTKESELDSDCRTLGKTPNSIIKLYEKENIDASKIIKNHKNQQNTTKIIRTFFPRIPIIPCYQLQQKDLLRKRIVMVSGGDDTFKQCCRYILNQTVIGINSDPEHSEGSLLGHTIEDLSKIKKALETDQISYSNWPRAKAYVNGAYIGQAMSEIYIGANDPEMMSHLRIILTHGEEDNLMGSGILIATAAGTRGWYHSAGGEILNPDEKKLVWRLRELYKGTHTKNNNIAGSISSYNETLTIYPTMHEQGRINLDGVKKTTKKLKRGSRVDIQISNTPLRTIVLDY